MRIEYKVAIPFSSYTKAGLVVGTFDNLQDAMACMNKQEGKAWINEVQTSTIARK